jgi:predicted SprT family Zn-dependent metalloprotease
MKLSGLVSACEDAWKAIQSTFDDVPEAVIVVGSGGRRATTLLGHFAKNSWDNEENEVHEVLLVAENLNRTAQEIFTTLLHEAVHGIAHSRGIKDVSGKRHNKRFALLCESVGMIPPESPDPKLGYSAAVLKDACEQKFSQAIEAIDVQLKLCRKLNLVPKNSKKTTWLAECQCERKLRLPKKTIVDPYDLQIVCQECGGSFFMNEEEIDAFNDLGA